jgi:hypothetical protein
MGTYHATAEVIWDLTGLAVRLAVVVVIALPMVVATATRAGMIEKRVELMEVVRRSGSDLVANGHGRQRREKERIVGKGEETGVALLVIEVGEAVA